MYLSLERVREGEKYQCVLDSPVPHTGYLARNPGMCPRLEIEPVTPWSTGCHSTH